MSESRLRISSIVLSMAVAIALSGCGGGGGGPTTSMSDDGSMMPPVVNGETEGSFPLPSGHGLAAGEITVAPGASDEHGNVVVSCPAGGGACVVTVAADGTAVYDRTGGIPTFVPLYEPWGLCLWATGSRPARSRSRRVLPMSTATSWFRVRRAAGLVS